MMSYEEFKQEVKKNIKEYLSDDFRDAEVIIQDILRNNDKLWDSISIKRNGETILPQVYLENFYSHYVSTESFTSTMLEMTDTLQNRRIQDSIADDFKDIGDYEKIKDNITLKLVNVEKNKKMLSEFSHKNIENTDLAVVFNIEVRLNSQETGLIMISNRLFSEWDISIDSLYDNALKNTETKHPFILNSIESILYGNAMSANMEKDTENVLPAELDDYTLYVLTSGNNFNGAVTLLYHNLMDKISERFGGDFYIFPSSVHEIILMKDNGLMEANELQRMVMEFNITEVKSEDILSDRVFYYDCMEHSLSMLETTEQTKEFLFNQFDANDYDTQENEDEEDFER